MSASRIEEFRLCECARLVTAAYSARLCPQIGPNGSATDCGDLAVVCHAGSTRVIQILARNLRQSLIIKQNAGDCRASVRVGGGGVTPLCLCSPALQPTAVTSSTTPIALRLEVSGVLFSPDSDLFQALNSASLIRVPVQRRASEVAAMNHSLDGGTGGGLHSASTHRLVLMHSTLSQPSVDAPFSLNPVVCFFQSVSSLRFLF